MDEAAIVVSCVQCFRRSSVVSKIALHCGHCDWTALCGRRCGMVLSPEIRDRYTGVAQSVMVVGELTGKTFYHCGHPARPRTASYLQPACDRSAKPRRVINMTEVETIWTEPPSVTIMGRRDRLIQTQCSVHCMSAHISMAKTVQCLEADVVWHQWAVWTTMDMALTESDLHAWVRWNHTV